MNLSGSAKSCLNREFRELVSWGGSTAPLSFYSAYPDVLLASVDAQSLQWRAPCLTVDGQKNRLTEEPLGITIKTKFLGLPECLECGRLFFKRS